MTTGTFDILHPCNSVYNKNTVKNYDISKAQVTPSYRYDMPKGHQKRRRHTHRSKFKLIGKSGLCNSGQFYVALRTPLWYVKLLRLVLAVFLNQKVL